MPAQIECDSLNKILRGDSSLSPNVFSCNEIVNLQNNYPTLTDTRGSKKLTPDIALLNIGARFQKADKSTFDGAFMPLVLTAEGYRNNGSLQIIEINKDDRIKYKFPQAPQKIVFDNPEIFNTINQKLKENNCPELNKSLLIPTSPSQELKVVDYEIIDDNKKFYSIIKLTLSDGTTKSYLSNVAGANGSQGDVWTACLPNGQYVVAESFRPLIAQKLIETPRGFSKDKFSKFEIETGLDYGKAQSIQNLPVYQDPFTDHCQIYNHFFDFTTQQYVKSDVHYEIIASKAISQKDLLDKLYNGEIRDAHTIASFANALLQRNQLFENDSNDLNNRYILLERQFHPLLGKTIETIPHGSGILDKDDSIIPDSGKTRIFYKKLVRNINEVYDEQKNKCLHPVSLAEALVLIKYQVLDIVSQSAIINYLLKTTKQPQHRVTLSC